MSGPHTNKNENSRLLAELVLPEQHRDCVGVPRLADG